MSKKNGEVKKILLVDDNEFIRKAVAALLQYKGYIVCTATNGAEALAMLKESRFDLILTDYLMPKMDGISFTTALRGNYQFGKPIIGMSGGIDLYSKEKWFESGLTAFLEKPLEPQDLFAILNNFLSS